MNENFLQLLSNIELTERQKEDASTKIKSVCGAVHDKYYESDYDGSTKEVVGSYRKDTNIRPPKDIDLLFIMPDEEFGRFDAGQGNRQSKLLQEIREILNERFSTTEHITAFGKVIVINFAESSHSVELLPAWKLSSGAFKIPNTENGGFWEIWNPNMEVINLEQSEEQNSLTLDFVKILKKWVENSNVPLPSYQVELLAVNFLNLPFAENENPKFPHLIAGFFDYLVMKRNSNLYSPASSQFINLGEDWVSRTQTAKKRSEKALNHESEGNLEEASKEWRKIFGMDFPTSHNKFAKYASETNIAQLNEQYPSYGDQDITEDYGIPIDTSSRYTVSIDADIEQKSFRKNPLSWFIDKGVPLEKKKRLTFKITDIDVPDSYRVMWKVRNYGSEAQRAKDLRGEISHDKGKEERIENTKYHGEHYVECYIIVNEECVAIDRILVPIKR
ncbi:MAG: nucleotidyltransferase [Candidatus Paceibacterota bacterium]